MKELLSEKRAVIAGGYCEAYELLQAQKLGLARYLRKPYTISSMAKIIREELELKARSTIS